MSEFSEALAELIKRFLPTTPVDEIRDALEEATDLLDEEDPEAA